MITLQKKQIMNDLRMLRAFMVREITSNLEDRYRRIFVKKAQKLMREHASSATICNKKDIAKLFV